MKHWEQTERRYYDPLSTILSRNVAYHFLDYCKKQNIPVILIQMPIYYEHQGGTRRSFPEEKHNFVYEIETLSLEYNLPVINLNHTLSSDMPETLFSNATHLNDEGAKIFTKRVAQAALKLQVFDDTFGQAKE